MSKKVFIATVIGLIILAGEIYFFAVRQYRAFQSPITNNQPWDEMIIRTFAQCDTDSDCVYAANDQCGVCQGGKTVFINKMFLDDFNQRFDKSKCTETEFPGCKAVSSYCERHTCHGITEFDCTANFIPNPHNVRMNEACKGIWHNTGHGGN